MPEFAMTPQTDLLLDVLYSKLDPTRIADDDWLPDDVLADEMEIVIDHLLQCFPHWEQLEKRDAKTAVLEKVRTSDRADLVEEISVRYPKSQRPLGQRAIQVLMFFLLGAFWIATMPIVWLSALCERVLPSCFPKRELAEDERIEPGFKVLCESSQSIAASLWPTKQPACYCCEIPQSPAKASPARSG